MQDMIFRTPENYRVEELIFDIVPFPKGYHALLRRAMFAKFHAIPHYAYMKLKMPWPKGVITVKSNTDLSLKIKEKSSIGPGGRIRGPRGRGVIGTTRNRQ